MSNDASGRIFICERCVNDQPIRCVRLYVNDQPVRCVRLDESKNGELTAHVTSMIYNNDLWRYTAFICSDRNRHIFVASTIRSRISQLDEKKHQLSLFVGSGNDEMCEGYGGQAAFTWVYAMIIDPITHYIFVCDSDSIRMISPQRQVSTCLRAGKPKGEHMRGNGSIASINEFSGLTLESNVSMVKECLSVLQLVPALNQWPLRLHGIIVDYLSLVSLLVTDEFSYGIHRVTLSF